MRKPACFLLLALLSFPLMACDPQAVEVDRVASPDGKVDLVISTAEAGATTSVGYHVNLVPPGAKPDLDGSVFVADKVLDLTASWISGEKVLIHCGDARVFRFQNFWQSRAVDNFAHVVRIGLEDCAD